MVGFSYMLRLLSKKCGCAYKHIHKLDAIILKSVAEYCVENNL